MDYYRLLVDVIFYSGFRVATVDKYLERIHMHFPDYQVVSNYSLDEIERIKNDGNKLTGSLHFTIYDHFGLDELDVKKLYVNLAGFRAWYVLKHYKQLNGQYKPFATIMEIDVPFETYLVTSGG